MIEVVTTHGRFLVHKDFECVRDTPVPGLVHFVDKVTEKIYWIGVDYIVYIGPADELKPI